MATMAQHTSRTSHLLELMEEGDDAFNARDFAAMDAVDHPEMVAHVTGAQSRSADAAHAAMIDIFPDVHVENDPYPVMFGSGDWITVITRATGTFSGELTLPEGGVIAPTAKAFDLDFATTARREGDLPVEEFVLWDSARQAQQIGLA